jgi:hypothetical protein
MLHHSQSKRQAIETLILLSPKIPQSGNFLFFLQRMYLSKPLTSLSCSLNAVFPCLKMQEHLCASVIFLTHFIISIAVLENVPPDAGLQKRATFSTLNVGLAGTGNQTWATCVASSGASRSAIHYTFHNPDIT